MLLRSGYGWCGGTRIRAENETEAARAGMSGGPILGAGLRIG
jgi:hypothetical protein